MALTKRQLAFLDDLFAGELDQTQVLSKHRITASKFSHWLAQEEFAAEFDRRVAWAWRLAFALIARYSVLAAAKLVCLTESTNPETARKAACDIIALAKTIPGLPSRSVPAQSARTAGSNLSIASTSDQVPSDQQIQTIDHQKALSLPGLPPRSVPADTVSKLLAILAEKSPSEK